MSRQTRVIVVVCVIVDWGGVSLSLINMPCCLGFDSKEEGDQQNGLTWAEPLDMDQYDAPKQDTLSGGLHYIFFVDDDQANRVNPSTSIAYNSVKSAM